MGLWMMWALHKFCWGWPGATLKSAHHAWGYSLSATLCPFQGLDEAHSSPGLHAAAGPGLAEECAMLVSWYIFQSWS